MEYISRSYYPVLALCMASVWNIRKQTNKNDSVQDSQLSRQVCARKKRASAGPLHAFLCVMTLHAAGPEIERADKSKQSLTKIKCSSYAWVTGVRAWGHMSVTRPQRAALRRPFWLSSHSSNHHSSAWSRAHLVQSTVYHAILVALIATTLTNYSSGFKL